jgi:hypothetical protein
MSSSSRFTKRKLTKPEVGILCFFLLILLVVAEDMFMLLGVGGEIYSSISSIALLLILVIAFKPQIKNYLQTNPYHSQDRGVRTFISTHPKFSQKNFERKVHNAFFTIQAALESGDISSARRYVTDEFYRSFLARIELMKRYPLKHERKDIQFKKAWIDKIESDAEFDIIHAGLHISTQNMLGRYCDAKYDSPEDMFDRVLGDDNSDDFGECWSFKRKKNATEGDLFICVGCPNCGAGFPKTYGQECKCEQCGTKLNSGDYDWVLTEITKRKSNPNSPREPTIINKIDSVVAELIGYED